jgi:hypothetical protein
VRRGLAHPLIGGTASRRLSLIVETPDRLPPSAQRLVAIPRKIAVGFAPCSGRVREAVRRWREPGCEKPLSLRCRRCRTPKAAAVQRAKNPRPRMNAEPRQGKSDTPRPASSAAPEPSGAVRRGLSWSMIGRTGSHRLSSAVATPDGLPPSAQRLLAIPGKTVGGLATCWGRVCGIARSVS